MPHLKSVLEIGAVWLALAAVLGMMIGAFIKAGRGLRRPRVFVVDESTWMAGYDGKSCLKAYLKTYGGEKEYTDEFGDPEELSDEDMQHKKLWDEDAGPPQTFQEALDEMIAKNVEFPTFFASSEY